MSAHFPHSRNGPPDFDSVAARRLREALGLTPAQLAHVMRTCYAQPTTAATVAAWELGEGAPTHKELIAMAGALWCEPDDLQRRATLTLRDYRTARGMGVSALAARIGMSPSVYERIEQSGHWSGNERQAAALAEVLELPLPVFVVVMGRAEPLADLLRYAVTTRWSAYVKPISQLLPLPRHQIEDVLQHLHAEYRAHMAAPPAQSAEGAFSSAQDLERAYLGVILDRFWARLRRLYA
ncbi:helix-turn-helix domain-containing protein [Streptomyces sp. NPDC127084]|uniref:helix-turn-helix domain-containing protein n=1 Tax=Streptomyces sp. NPDC127084 TaxID=3347133 RepID=UPI00366393B2